MKRKFLVTALFAVGLTTSFVSCSHETEISGGDGIEWDGTGLDPRIVHLFTNIAPTTRGGANLQSTSLALGRQVGVITSGGNPDQTNTPWTSQAASAGDMLVNGGASVYFNGNHDVDVYAYHPYCSNTSDAAVTPYYSNGTLNFSVKIDQSADADYLDSDLLCAKGTASYVNNPITLNFTHKLAKVCVTLKASSQASNVDNATVYICNTSISANLDVKTADASNSTAGTMTAVSGNVKEIKAGTTTAASSYTVAAIVVPQQITNGTAFIKVSLGNDYYYYTLDADKKLEEGHSYHYTLTVKDDKLRVITTSITDWDNEAIPASGDLYAVSGLVTGYSEVDKTVIVANGGELSTAITDAIKYEIDELTVVGNLNGDDITLLCDMAGSDGTATPTNGTLTNLDLSKANVEGDALSTNAFINSKLQTIILPESLKVIGMSTFQDCTKLETVTIQENVTTIEQVAFAGCTSLSTVYCYATTPPTLGTSVFGNLSQNITVHIPSTALSNYNSSTSWSSLGSNITITGDL